MSVIKQILDQFSRLEELIIEVKVNPKAKQEGITRQSTVSQLRVNLTTVPENNKANEALIKFLAKKMGLRRYQIEIIAGHRDRLKTIKLKR